MFLRGNDSHPVALERTFEARRHVALNNYKPSGHFPFLSTSEILYRTWNSQTSIDSPSR
jgi:hypothetical protein